MQTHSSWAGWFINNKAMTQETGIFKLLVKSWVQGIQTKQNYGHWLKKIDTVILAADSNRNIMILHSPKNFGGTRSHPKNKVVCMLGVGPQATCVLLDLNTAFRDLNSLSHQFTTSQDGIQPMKLPTSQHQKQTALLVFEGSAIFHPRSSSLEHNYWVEHKEFFQAHSHHLTCSMELQQRARAQSNCNNPHRWSQCLAVWHEGRLGSQDKVFR